MSDWEIVPDNMQAGSQQQPQSQSDWEMVNEMPPESTWQSVKAAPGRVYQDVVGLGNQAYNAIPVYLQKSKTEVPAAANILFNQFLAGNNLPHQMTSDQLRHASGQMIAGLGEGVKNMFNMPHDLTNYLTNRLHLFPENWNQKIQMARIPDEETQRVLDAKFGQPNQSGEAFLRGVGRNITNISAGLGAAKLLNPLQLTSRGIAKGVTKELTSQVNKHNAMYSDLWNKAQKSGYNKVSYDKNALNLAEKVLDKYYPEKSGIGLRVFLEDPSLKNAQATQSELGNMRRTLEDKSKEQPLSQGEKGILKILSNAEKNIEGNMFKNAAGEKNESLANRYHEITKSYAKNVVPYRYDPDIQKYLSKKSLANELVQALSKGSFAAKKGWSHPSIKIRNAILPTAKGIGYLGGSAYLLNQLMGNSTPPNK